MTRRIATPNEIFDLLDDAKGRKFATIGIVKGADLKMPKVRRKNPETNYMKNYDDYEALGKQLGYDSEIGGVVKFSSYTLQLSNREQVARDYDKYVDDFNNIRAQYGLGPVKHRDGYTQTIGYGQHGVSVYRGNNKEKEGNAYYPTNSYGVVPKNAYYIVDKDGHIVREVSKDELKDLLNQKKDGVSGEAELRKMGVEEERIKEYIEKASSLKMAYKVFKYSSILYIVGSVNGERFIYINTNLNAKAGNATVDPSDFIKIVEERYKDDLADVPTDDSGEFDNLNEEFEGNDTDDDNPPVIRTNENLDKGMTLMAEALKQYEEGKFELAEHSREQANHFFDMAKDELSTEDGAEKAMYGECRNFGIIYNVIEENANKLYETKEGRKTIGKVIGYIKNNNVLLHEFKVYDAFVNPMDVENVDNYVNEAVSVVKRYGKKKLTEENSKLAKLIKKLKFNENIDILDDAINLYESIEYVLLNEPSISNVKKYSEIKDVLRENVDRNNRSSNKNVNMDEMRDNGVRNLTEKYNNELNDDEKRLVEEIASSTDKAEKRFNEIKNSLLLQLQEKINESDDSDKEGWQHIYETVNGKTFEKTTALNTVADMISLKETIE